MPLVPRKGFSHLRIMMSYDCSEPKVKGDPISGANYWMSVGLKIWNYSFCWKIKQHSVLLHSRNTKIACKATNIIKSRYRLKFANHMVILIADDILKQRYIPFNVNVLKKLGSDGLCPCTELVINLYRQHYTEGEMKTFNKSRNKTRLPSVCNLS